MSLMVETEPELFIVSPEEVGERIDKLLALRYPTYSRTYFQKILDDHFVLINGKAVTKRTILNEGDEIEVFFQLTPESTLEAEEIPLDILYEDEFMIAVNKPAGMVVHPAPGHPNGTFVNALLGHCKDLAPSLDPLRPGIVHRLDKDTSGVLVAAKTAPAHQKLVHLFSSRQVKKFYLAICCGKPENGMINLPIGRHPSERKEMAVVETGKEAISQIRVLAFNDKISLVQISPHTGRTHQIRVHLKHHKCPILGDSVYGNDRLNELFEVKRQLLHAYRIDFTHPISGSPLSFTAPVPADLREWIQRLA
jgi:23S rRNA pseudouridine1911/1915/1917 synthase